MTDNQQAFKEAEKELAKDRINEIKEVMKSILQKIQDEKDKKAQAEENLRLLKLDMDDLRAGKIEKIKERHEKSSRAKSISPITGSNLLDFATYSTTSSLGYCNAVLTSATGWTDATSGTYLVSCANGTSKEMNL